MQTTFNSICSIKKPQQLFRQSMIPASRLVLYCLCIASVLMLQERTPETISSPPRFWTSALTLLQMLSWWQYRAILCR